MGGLFHSASDFPPGFFFDDRHGRQFAPEPFQSVWRGEFFDPRPHRLVGSCEKSLHIVDAMAVEDSQQIQIVEAQELSEQFLAIRFAMQRNHESCCGVCGDRAGGRWWQVRLRDRADARAAGRSVQLFEIQRRDFFGDLEHREQLAHLLVSLVPTLIGAAELKDLRFDP